LRDQKEVDVFIEWLASAKWGQKLRCVNVCVHGNALTRGEIYSLAGFDSKKRVVQMRGGRARKGWFPAYCFAPPDEPIVTLESYTIDDPLEEGDDALVDVTVTLSNGEKRFCIMATPVALSKCGNWVEGTKVPFHYGNGFLIVVRKLSVDLIDRVLRYLDSQDELVECTTPLV